MVRRFRTFHTIDAADLVAVEEFLTPNGPSYRLTVRGSDGRRATSWPPWRCCVAGTRPCSGGY